MGNIGMVGLAAAVAEAGCPATGKVSAGDAKQIDQVNRAWG
jgi:hypothetical protein